MAKLFIRIATMVVFDACMQGWRTFVRPQGRGYQANIRHRLYYSAPVGTDTSCLDIYGELSQGEKWWQWVDSNHRPHHYE